MLIFIIITLDVVVCQATSPLLKYTAHLLRRLFSEVRPCTSLNTRGCLKSWLLFRHPHEFKIKSLYSNDLILNIASKSKEAVQKLKFLDSPLFLFNTSGIQAVSENAQRINTAMDGDSEITGCGRKRFRFSIRRFVRKPLPCLLFRAF